MIRTLLILVVSHTLPQAHATELKLQETSSSSVPAIGTSLPQQLPMSRSASGLNDIKTAWFAKPTSRYKHGVLGDEIEAAQLRVITHSGKTLMVELEQQRVFEDLTPRVVDLDGDDKDEIIVVESDENYGASLSVFGIKDGLLQRITATEFLGQPYRWLNPAGIGDFDADGSLDIALIATPHIGGILKLYHYNKTGLSLFAQKRDVSTHSIGSTELALAAVVAGTPDKLLLPNQNHTSLQLIEWNSGKWRELSTIELPSKITSSLTPLSENSWQFASSTGKIYKISIVNK